MAKYFAGGHLRFVQGEWRDDNGNPVEIERVRRGRWEEAIEPLGWHNVIVASCSVCGDSWVLDEFTIDEYAKWHQTVQAVEQRLTDILRCLTRRMKMMSNKEPSAMDCWHFIAPILPIADDYSQSVYVKTFHAFKLLEDEEKKKNGKIDR